MDLIIQAYKEAVRRRDLHALTKLLADLTHDELLKLHHELIRDGFLRPKNKPTT